MLNKLVFLFNQNKNLLGALVILFSLVTSLIFLSFFKNMGPIEHQVPGSDYGSRYKPMSLNIMEGRGIPIEKNSLVIGTPGYPLILIPILFLSNQLGINELPLIVVFNTLIAALTAFFLFIVGKSIFNTKIAFIASLLWSTYPLNLWFIKNPNTEVPFILLLYVSIWIYLLGIQRKKSPYFFTTGIMLGLLMLIRPVALFLPLLFIILLFVLRLQYKEEGRSFFLNVLNFQPLRQGGALLLGTLLIILPWIGYVFKGSGHFILVSSIGTPTAVSGLSYAFVGDGRHKETVSKDIKMLMENVRDAHLTTGMDIVRFTIEELFTQPLTLFKLFFLKFIRSWYATYGMWWEREILLMQIPYLASGIIGIIFVLRKYRKQLFGSALFLLLILYFWIMTFLGLSIVRYMVPVMGFLMIFSSITINIALSKLSSWNT